MGEEQTTPQICFPHKQDEEDGERKTGGAAALSEKDANEGKEDGGTQAAAEVKKKTAKEQWLEKKAGDNCKE